MAKILMGGGWKGDAPSWYRVECPARWLKARGLSVQTVYGTLGSAGPELEDTEVFMGQRSRHPSVVLGIAGLRARGVRTIYELDDDIWRVPKWSPLAKNFDQDAVEAMEKIMRSMDEVVVSTSKLAEYVVRFNPNVTVIGNGIPLDLIPPAGPRAKPGIRIGWAGSGTHQGDLAVAVPALKQLLAKRKDVTIVMMGEGFPDLPIEKHPWTHPKDYYGCLRDLELDVFIAPLARHQFNESKSAVKVQEAGAMGWPVVASDFGPYRCVQNGVTGFKVKDDRQDLWYGALQQLCESAELRMKLGQQGRQWVEKHGSMDVTGPAWERVLTKSLTERYGKAIDPKVVDAAQESVEA